ncbi:hypothetical protein H8E77_42650 [bacterium]|nr:hypothetical protein [bacterium]
MSGEKRTTIDSAEYRRLCAAQSQLRAIQQNLPGVIENIQRENIANLQRALEPLEQRQRTFQQAVVNLHEDVRDMEMRTAQRLEEQQREMREMVQDTAGQLRQETQELIAEQEHRLTNLVEEERRTREQQMQDVNQRLDDIAANEQRKVDLANSYIEAAEVLRDFIENNYRHEHFATGELNKLEEEIRRARGNVASRLPEAAISTAQHAYQELSNLRLRLEEMEQEWQFWRSRALESMKEMQSLVQRNRECSALDLEGKETGDSVDVNWWTNGKLEKLEEEISELITKIEDEQDLSRTDELRQFVEQTTPDLKQRLEEIIAEARLEISGSQLRINIADLVVQALEEKAFSVPEGTYEGEDYRNGYAAKTAHLDGSEVVITVTPIEDEPGRNELRIHSYDEDNLTEYELFERAKSVTQALRQRGLEVAEPQATGAHADQSIRDIGRIQRGEQPLPRSVASTTESVSRAAV